MRLPRRIALFITGMLFAMSSHSAAPQPPAPGSLPTDAEGFAFLAGHWRIHNRRLKEPLTGRVEWMEFESSARFITLLDGLVSIEELRDGQGAVFGSAVRSFDRERRVWLDRWLPVRSGLLQEPSEGRFENGTGTFIAPDVFEEKPMLTRGIWRRITPREVTWQQACSLDNGTTWETNWEMRFIKVGE